MTSIQDGWAGAEEALGAEALRTLDGRRLLRRMVAPAMTATAEERVDRVGAAVAGLALGDAVATWARTTVGPPDGVHRWLADVEPALVSATTQSFVLAAEAWSSDGWSAPCVVSDRLAALVGTMRRPGRALRRAATARTAGAPWYQAASGSCGDAVLARSVAVGLVRPGGQSDLGFAASLDAVVTHASSRAAASAAALAGIVAALVERPADQSPRDCLAGVLEAVDHRAVRDALHAALVPTELPPTGSPDGGVRPRALEVLALAVWCALLSDDAATALGTAVEFGGANRTAAAVTGALFGAIHGEGSLPARSASIEGAHAYSVLADRITARLAGASSGRSGAEIWFLLDRSGSMQAIAREVVIGFDRFFTEQRQVGGDATVTVVQFDDHDPHDVIVDARPLAEVRSIADRFEPRGCTPLYDAIGQLLDRVEEHGGDDADQLVVVMTDGMENASRRWDQPGLFRRISDLRDRGWTFVFLGANQDSYEVGGSLGVGAGNVSNYAPSAAGMAATYTGLSRTVREWRGKDRVQRRRDQDDFWGGRKEAEDL